MGERTIEEVAERGTPLAQSSVVPVVDPACPQRSLAAEVWRRNRDQFFLNESKHTSKRFLSFGMMVQAAIVTLFAVSDYPVWRVITLGAVYCVFGASHRFIVHRGLRRGGRSIDQTFIWMNLSAQIFIVGSTTITGGLHSPFIPATLLPSIISLLFFGPHAVSRWMAVANALLILAALCLPAAVVGPALPDPNYVLILFIGLAWNLFMLHMMVGKLTMIAAKTGESVASLREERLTELDAAMERLQGVGAKVAHELKNPLASIKGLCQLVARTPESERTQERLAVVASEISRMETILNEYLSFSRPLEDLAPQAIDLKSVSQDVIDVLGGRAEQAGVVLALDGGITPAKGDPRRLKEALINLVSNAIEATPTGGRVELKLRGSRDQITLEVRDTGRGISAEDLERLGTSFFTTRPNGTGLGVVLAQGVIAQHGGQLRYASTVGTGTTATITLPVDIVPDAGRPSAPNLRVALAESRA